ncbi:MAG: 16S rRNA (uracil(1498)-N(3))-methyltransferase [Gammaproteobacteria bacterium]
MHTPRIYTPIELDVGQEVILNQTISHHIRTVLRKTKSDPVILFNAIDHYDYSGFILELDKKIVKIKLEKKLQRSSIFELKINLYPALIKPDPFDWLIQKATELGVFEIHPVFTEYTDVKINQDFSKKLEHWQKIIIRAAEQCNRNTVPKIYRPEKIKNLEFKDDFKNDLNIVLHHLNGKCLKEIKNVKLSSDRINLFTGPEGGFSDQDWVDFENLGIKYQLVLLKPHVLKAETASVSAMSYLVNAIN